MPKILEIKITIEPNNTPQNWSFSKEVSGIEQLALWTIVKELAEQNIKKIFELK